MYIHRIQTVELISKIPDHAPWVLPVFIVDNIRSYLRGFTIYQHNLRPVYGYISLVAHPRSG